MNSNGLVVTQEREIFALDAGRNKSESAGELPAEPIDCNQANGVTAGRTRASSLITGRACCCCKIGARPLRLEAGRRDGHNHWLAFDCCTLPSLGASGGLSS